MNKVKYSEDLINMSASAFLRDTHFFDGRNKHGWTTKLKKIIRNPFAAYYVYYYNEEEVTTIKSSDFILDDNKFVEFVRQKAITLLDNGWRPVEKEVKTTITELPNTLEYL